MIEARLALARGDFRLDVDLRLPAAGASALYGPSGCGKTTLLRALAGLERAAGRVVVDGAVWQDDTAGVFLPPHRRPLGYVIQEAALFPHLSVEGNLQYGRRRSGAEVARVDLAAVIDLLGIGALLPRRPATLSGGERQRVAIARALATGPRLLLMDEPLAALDPARKAEILPYLERLHTRLALPIVYVTHAMDEVARLADHLVLLRDGRVQAAGPLTALLARADLAVDDDAGALIEATVAEHDAAYALSRIVFPGGALWLGRVTAEVGQAVRVRVPARDVSLVRQPPGPTSILNVLPVTVSALHAAGATVVVGLVCVRGEDGGALEGGGADGGVGPAAGRAAGADGAYGIAGAGGADGSDGAAAGRTGEGAAAAAGTSDGATGPARLLARITRRSADALGLQVGDRLFAQVKGVSLM